MKKKVSKIQIETLYDLKKVLNKISDNDLKMLALGFNMDSDGSPALMAWPEAAEDDAHIIAMKIFEKKSVALVHTYFNKLIEAVELFNGPDGQDDVDYYGNEPISTETKFNKHK